MLKNLGRRALGVARRNPGKTALGVAGAVGAGIALYKGYKALKGRGHKKSSTMKLRSQVQRLSLKIKKVQLQRKLFKEQSKVGI